MVISSHWLYEYGFAKHKVAETTGLSELELKKIANNLSDYLNSKRDTAQIMVSKGGQEFELFTEREIVHLKDVKDLFQLDNFVQHVTSALVVVFGLVLVLRWWRGGWQKLVGGFLWGSILTIGLIIILALGSLMSFDQLLLAFHLISFPNEYWILDPSQHYLIMIVTQEFLYEAALFIFGAVLVEALIVGGIAFGIRRLCCLKSYKCYNS